MGTDIAHLWFWSTTTNSTPFSFQNESELSIFSLCKSWVPGKLEHWWKKKTLAVSLAVLDCGTDGFVVLNVYGYGCVLFCPFPVQKKHTIKGSKLTKCFLEKVWTEHLHYKMYHSCFRKTFVWVCSLVSFRRSILSKEPPSEANCQNVFRD